MDNSTAEKLSRLFELYKAGSITQEEYNLLKTRLIQDSQTNDLLLSSTINEGENQKLKPKIVSEQVKEKSVETAPDVLIQFTSPIRKGKQIRRKYLVFSIIISIAVILPISFFVLLKGNNDEQLVDIDSNVYKTVNIGKQKWMAENLNVTTFRNGDPIPEAKSNDEWRRAGESKQPAWCYYNNDSKNGKIYGKLYNWYAFTDKRGLAPSGWSIPSNKKWDKLLKYLIANGFNYNETFEDNKLGKSLASTSNWKYSSNEGAIGNDSYPNKRNITGFTAYAGGSRGYDGEFSFFGEIGYWWTSTKSENSELEEFPDEGIAYNLYYEYNYLYHFVYGKENGFSVRCIKNFSIW